MASVMDSPVGSRLAAVNCMVSTEDCVDAPTTRAVFYGVRARAGIGNGTCVDRVSSARPDEPYECFDDYCLFDVHQDPCEYRNVAAQHRDTLNAALDVLNRLRGETVPQYRPDVDPGADPRLFDGYWDTWMEPVGSNVLKGSAA